MQYVHRVLAVCAVEAMSASAAFGQPYAWNYLNVESGGYVTEIVPVKYPAGSQPASIDQQVLYARTDIGGIYRSSDNGATWTIASNYYNEAPPPGQPGISLSELSIQGLTARHDPATNKQFLLVAWGQYSNDADRVQYQSVWRSTNNGDLGSWAKPTIEAPGLWFQGNNFQVKISGPCITYDPNNLNGEDSWAYMGGFGPNDGVCRLFKSTNDGVTWQWNIPGVNNFPGQAEEGIICISIKENNTDHIWVGTTHGIVYTTNGGTSWNRRSISGVEKPHVKRILLNGAGNSVTGVMFTWGITRTQTGVARMRQDNSWQIEDLTPTFLAGSPVTGSEQFSALAYVDGAGDTIIAGKHSRPFRKTTDFGTSWFGEGTNPAPAQNIVRLRYDEPTVNNIPSHSQEYQNHPTTQDDQLYSGMSMMIRNPNPGWGSQWYLSGGAGARMTTSPGVVGGSFLNTRWKYTVMGQAMTVNYDVVFSTLPWGRQAVYLPLSDWTMGATYGEKVNSTGAPGLITERPSYDRQLTYQPNLYDTYISNVTRLLVDPEDASVTYATGGSVYNFGPENKRAGFYERVLDENGDVSTTRRQPAGTFLTIDDRVIADAIIDRDEGVTHIVAVVGRSEAPAPPNPAQHLGVFRSTDHGMSWEPARFTERSMVQGISTEEAYAYSVLPTLGPLTGSLGDLFSGYFALTNGGSGLVFLWLGSQGEEPYGGGLFISTNHGATWRAGDLPPGFLPEHFKEGGSLKCIGTDVIALAVGKTQQTNQMGLYKGLIDRNNDGEVTWGDAIGGFESASHLDVQGNRWAVYAKSAGDLYSQIYRSLDNGQTWQRIPPGGNKLPHFPRIHSLRIRPAPHANELWIAAAGQGVWVYREFDPSYTTIPYQAAPTWNVLSVPLVVSEFLKTAVWPSSVSTAQWYEPGTGYVERDTLENGLGYWIKFNQAEQIYYSGQKINVLHTPVAADWNLIGSISWTISTSTICTSPPGIISSAYFRYEPSQGYVASNEIVPGRGYWVKSSSEGTITMSYPPQACNDMEELQLDEMDKFIITDSEGKTQELYVANATRDTTVLNFDLEMPPPFPDAEFDARFEDGEAIKAIVPDTNAVELVIDVATENWPVTVAWELNPANGISYTITGGGGSLGKGSGRLARRGTAMILQSSRGKIRLEATAGTAVDIPEEFALTQNYPNPFNPRTVIEYHLPVDARVKLMVYDILGREVAGLVNGIEEAGYRSAVFDARQFTSGVYFYSIEAVPLVPTRDGSFRAVKKMLLLK